MSSLSALSPAFRPNAGRVAVIAVVAGLLVGLGFLVPFWITLCVAAGVIVVASVVGSVRRASRTIDRIMAEELDHPR